MSKRSQPSHSFLYAPFAYAAEVLLVLPATPGVRVVHALQPHTAAVLSVVFRCPREAAAAQALRLPASHKGGANAVIRHMAQSFSRTMLAYRLTVDR